MDAEAAVAFFRRHHHAVLVTQRRDGTPQSSPVAVGVHDDGRLAISTRETAMKTKNLRRSPTAWVCGFTDDFFGPWVQASGPVEVLSLPEAMEPLVAYYRSTVGEHPAWDEYRAAMESERRCLLLVTVEQAGPDVSG